MRLRFAVLAFILVLATMLLCVSLWGVIPEQALRGQARNCGVVGIISFVGLCLVAGARQGIVAILPQTLAPSPSPDPALAAARRALYEQLREIGLPTA